MTTMQWHTVDEVADIHRIKPDTVRKRFNAGLYPHAQKLGNRIRIPQCCVDGHFYSTDSPDAPPVIEKPVKPVKPVKKQPADEAESIKNETALLKAQNENAKARADAEHWEEERRTLVVLQERTKDLLEEAIPKLYGLRQECDDLLSEALERENKAIELSASITTQKERLDSQKSQLSEERQAFDRKVKSLNQEFGNWQADKAKIKESLADIEKQKSSLLEKHQELSLLEKDLEQSKYDLSQFHVLTARIKSLPDKLSSTYFPEGPDGYLPLQDNEPLPVIKSPVSNDSLFDTLKWVIGIPAGIGVIYLIVWVFTVWMG